MAKKVIRLSESEFAALIKKTVNEAINEIGGRSFAQVGNVTTAAQNRQVNGEPSPNPNKSNMDIILQGMRMKKDLYQQFILPFKGKYLFHGKDLKQMPSLVYFNLSSLYKIDYNEAILKGEVIIQDGDVEIETDKIFVTLSNDVTYTLGKNKKKYILRIDYNDKEKWNTLISELHKCVEYRINR